jgi:hypothetical protein
MHATEQNKGPQRGGSKLGRNKSKPRHRMEGHTMFYTGYFFVDATQAENFWRRYSMSLDVFMSIIHGVREY